MIKSCIKHCSMKKYSYFLEEKIRNIKEEHVKYLKSLKETFITYKEFYKK